MAHKIRFSPIMSMFAHWKKMIAGKNPIDMTSLVTRIVAHVGALENAQLTYLPSTEAFQFKIGLEHFMQGHLMREGLGNSLFMCYLGYDKDIELPCPRLSLVGQETNLVDGEGAGALKCCLSGNTRPVPTQYPPRAGRTIATTSTPGRIITAEAPGRHYPAGRTFYRTSELQQNL
jgi:hypothetical protein